MAEPAGSPAPAAATALFRTAPPTDEICPVCFWQDDFVDNQDTDVLGPNRVTLSVARSTFSRWGASEEGLRVHVRPPRPEEGPPEPWTGTRRGG